MGGASKILMLLSTPFPLLCPRPSGALRVAGRSRAVLSSISSSSNFNHNSPRSSLHPELPFTPQSQSQPLSAAESQGGNGDLSSLSPCHKSPLPFSSFRHPWPEWTKLLDNLISGGYYPPTIKSITTRTAHVGGAHDDDDNDDDSFAVYESLQEDFVRGVEACLAFARDRPDALRFFTKKNVEVVVNDGSPFLFKNGANSAKRMKLFLSSDDNNVIESERAQTLDLMRYLLSYAYTPLTSSGGTSHENTQLVEASVRILFTELVNISEPIQKSSPTESTRRLIPVSHEQVSKLPRRNIEMKRGDWICEKCNLMNFARNTRCFECEEQRPRRQLTGREWECPQCEFFNYGRNSSCLRCDCKRPEQTVSAPLNQSSTIDQILTKRNTDMPELEREAERKFASPQIGVSTGTGSGRLDETSINRSLDRIFGRTSSQPADAESNYGTESKLRQSIARSDPGYIPFVPLPPDMFSKSRSSTSVVTDAKDDSAPTRTAGPVDPLSISSVKSAEDGGNDGSSERLSQKVAELDGFKDLASEARDGKDDFPEMMPMRRGENRFVVSKKKDRSLTSPQYKRRLAMEQAAANKTDFVPFVPFPPNYFAKKDDQPGAPTPASISDKEVNVDSSSGLGNQSQQMESKSDLNKHDISKSFSQSDDLDYSRLSNLKNVRGTDNSRRIWSDGVDQVSNKYNTNNSSITTGSSTKQTKDYQGFSGKSLEGSAVTAEPDPLDMSEEAKAARWFRRAAQIKDISELSAIPDEDFPEIMPMRKGVNRFVVSKRKTPLERRLTSPQYRKNLPIVSSEPEKKG